MPKQDRMFYLLWNKTGETFSQEKNIFAHHLNKEDG